MENYEKEIMQQSKVHAKLQTLMYHVSVENLLKEHAKQSKSKASGVDGIGKEEYGERIQSNIDTLVSNMKKFSYRPKPVRRTYIPKANGTMRPLGIPSYEDKLVQGVMANILNAVYEPRFLECSYGFRKGKSAHGAIKEINAQICRRYNTIGWIVDADIKGFFDHIDHEWLMRFLRHDIEDENFLRYIHRFLKAGIMDGNAIIGSEEGSPQGGLISPCLANVYLHYVLDLWFEKVVKKYSKGRAHLIRYADDFVAMFQYEEDAVRFYKTLPKRLGKFNLELATDKSRIIPFGRDVKSKESFDFLGFSHFNGKAKNGYYTVIHRTSKKKLKVKRREIKQWIRGLVKIPIRDLISQLNVKLIGHYRYYGISGNSKSISDFQYYCVRTLFRALRHRGQKHRLNWDRFHKMLRTYPIANPKIYVNIW